MAARGHGYTSIQRPEPTTNIVVSIHHDKIESLKLHISAYAGEVPEDVADLLWQIHRKLNF